MKKGSLAKYKIGLGILSLFAVVLLVIVLTQANATRQDTNAYNQATTIANTLNNYVDNNGVIPLSLSDAGVSNIPTSVSYQKLSDSSYKFCVNYKTTSSGFDTTGVESELVTGSTDQSSSYSTSNLNTDLYLDSTHHKGENCQSITPDLYNFNNFQ